MARTAHENVRFGPFELDLRRGELRKEGRRIRLQEQPFQILRMLIESPGEVVTREDIQNRLWPQETAGEFDLSINAAIRRLRDTLRDSADNPRYVKTIPRRGYCFIGEIQTEFPAQAERIAAIAENAAENHVTAPWAQEALRLPGLPLRLRIIVPAMLAGIIVILGAIAWDYRHRAAPLQPLMRLDLDLGSAASSGPDSGAHAIISPNGTRLVYVSHSKLFTRRLDQAEAAEATELPGTEGADAPFFSPDGQWVGFFAGGRLNKISMQKRQVIVLGDGSAHNGASWGEDGAIMAGFDFRLARIPSGGGTPTFVTELAPGEIVHRWPQILPGGKAVIFSAYRSLAGLDGATIEVVSLKDGRRKTLVPGGTYGRYLPSGHLVYLSDGTLFAAPFDVHRLEVHGTPTAVLKNVAYNAATGSTQIDFSPTGTLVYQSSRAGSGLVTVQWLDESGNTRPLLPAPGNYLSPTLSPDGSRLALTSEGDIWVYELGRGEMTKVTFGGSYTSPVWSADGHYIVFRSAQGMFSVRADGTAEPQLLTQGLPWSFTGNGKRLAFNLFSPANIDDIWTVPVETGSSGLRIGKPELFLQAPFHERSPTFSPDGRWIAYQSNETGRYRIYVQAFPDRHVKQQISNDRGLYPAWSRNGHDLFFVQGGVLMAASYQVQGDSFVVETPRVWFEKKIASFPSIQSYDPAPDGKRVVALMPADTPEEPHDRVIFLLNFFDELRRRVPLRAN